MKKRIATMVMAMGIVACTTMVPMRVEATVTPEDGEIAEQEGQQEEPETVEFITLSDIMMLDEITAQTKEEQPEILIRIVRTEIMDVTIKDGGMIESNPRELVTPYYIVTKEDETIMSIAYKLQVTESYLLSVNPDYKWEVDEPLARYAYVELPEIYWQGLTDVYYIIGKGDCLSAISDFFNTEVSDIQSLNPKIKDLNLIYEGDLIRVK